MSRWLITGARGLLGQELTRLLSGEPGERVTALGHDALDIRDPGSVHAAFERAEPDVVVNCAAWTAADDAEDNEAKALAVNGTGVRNLAATCAATGVSLIHVSTDYVFDGSGTQPYAEYAAPAPINAYGRTKLAGERAVAELLPDSSHILRVAWLYGEYGRNFPRTMMRLERQRDVVEVVDDQHGQPTWAHDVAERICLMVRSGVPAGIYHATNSGHTTWHGLAREVFRLLGADPERVRPITSAQRGGRARRPPYSVLGHDAWPQVSLQPLRDWRSALHSAFPSLAAAHAASGHTQQRSRTRGPGYPHTVTRGQPAPGAMSQRRGDGAAPALGGRAGMEAFDTAIGLLGRWWAGAGGEPTGSSPGDPRVIE